MRTAKFAGQNLDVVREYTYPDGEPAAREHVVYHGDELVSYELEELQIRARGKATIVSAAGEPGRKSIRFEYERNKKVKHDKEALPKDAVISDMIAPFLLAHWKELLAGQKVRCRYLVVERLETIGFTFSKQSELVRDGKNLVAIRMEPTSRIISALVDPLEFLIEKDAPHHVLEYKGRTTPKLRSGNKFSELDARTVFEW